MKNSLVIFLLALQLVTSTDLAELFKIPVLISHYHEHKGTNQNFTFFTFLKMHYFNGRPHDNTDMELPFKTNSTAALVSMNFSTPLPCPPALPVVPVVLSEDREYKVYTVSFPPGQNKSIFQPPRTA